jgi:hypothetical protein
MSKYIVCDDSADFSQPLALRLGTELPERGILDWGEPVAIFDDKTSARAAITRTAAYAKAFEKPNLHPARENMKIRPAVLV